MTDSETRFREYLKKSLNDEKIWIRKLPDKKQTGLSTGLGLPDYMIITKGTTLFFEVKKSSNKKSFAMKDISDSQVIEFNKILNAGGKIFLAIYIGKELYIVDYKYLAYMKLLSTDKSIPIESLIEWRIKWNQINLHQP